MADLFESYFLCHLEKSNDRYEYAAAIHRTPQYSPRPLIQQLTVVAPQESFTDCR